MPTKRKTSRRDKWRCGRKKPYPSEKQARAAARSLHQQDGGRMTVHRCNVGIKGEPRHWHVARVIGRR